MPNCCFPAIITRLFNSFAHKKKKQVLENVSN